jgi:hypothetical protein
MRVAWQFILLLCLASLWLSCDDDPAAPVDQPDDTNTTPNIALNCSTFAGDRCWTIPAWEGIYLSFKYSDSINVDCQFAGQIQFRLNVARTVDDDLTDWRLSTRWRRRILSLNLSDEVVAGFDTSALTFSNLVLDSLLRVYPVEQIEIRYHSIGNYALLHFRADYNMPELAKVFDASASTIWAEPSYVSRIYPPAAIDLSIDEDLYKFLFIGGWEQNGDWEIWVVDDQAHIISRPPVATSDLMNSGPQDNAAESGYYSYG